jgi:hypothetical protein
MIDDQRVAPVGELTQIGDGGRLMVQAPGRVADRRGDGVVAAAGGDQQRPAGLLPVLTLAGERRTKLAVAASNSGRPGVGMAQRW